MIECPKCNFRQPKDQYCANCGIDIIAYKPPPDSKSKNFFKSGLFQITILFFAAAISAYFVVQTNHQQNWIRKFSYTKKINDSTKTSTLKTVSEKNLNSETDSLNIQVEASTAAVANELANINRAENALATTDSKIFSDIKLTYAEISREDLSILMTESQRSDLYQNSFDVSAGIYPNYKLKSNFQMKILKTETKKIHLNKTEALLSGKTFDDTSTFIGIQTNIGLKSMENEAAQGHLNITKISRFGKIDLPLEFQLQKNALFFVNWKTALVGFENETGLFNIPPFGILQSQDFLNQKTEFIILIETVSLQKEN